MVCVAEYNATKSCSDGAILKKVPVTVKISDAEPEPEPVEPKLYGEQDPEPKINFK